MNKRTRIRTAVALAALTLALLVGGGWLVRRSLGGPAYSGQRLTGWLGQLASPSYERRAAAEAALRTIGPEAVPELMRVLRVREGGLHRFQVVIRNRILPSRSSGPALERLREQAALLLARIGEPASPAAPLLIERLGDRDPDVVRAAELALRRIGAVSVPQLVDALEHGKPSIRAKAAELLACRDNYGPSLDRAIPRLILALWDQDKAVRVASIRTLGTLKPEGVPVPAALVRALNDNHDEVRSAAARALGESGPSAQEAIGALTPCLSAEHPDLRIEAARALWRIEGRPERIVPALCLELRNPQAHWQAAFLLGEMGPRAEAAIPALLEALETEIVHRPSRTPASAALALARMGPAAVPGLRALLEHPQSGVRVGAALALATHGTEARSCVSGLRRLLDEGDPEARLVASGTLGAIGVEARPALPELERMAQETDGYLRTSALTAISRIRTESGNN